MSARSDWSSDVRTVTARIFGAAAPYSPAAARAAAIMARPPTAWIVIRSTPNFPPDFTALATVLGMSWNLRSRKTLFPNPFTAFTTSGPSAVNSSRPIL